MAAEQLGRRCYAMELSPAFVDAAIGRWERCTGQKAVLEETGMPFEQVAESFNERWIKLVFLDGAVIVSA